MDAECVLGAQGEKGLGGLVVPVCLRVASRASPGAIGTLCSVHLWSTLHRSPHMRPPLIDPSLWQLWLGLWGVGVWDVPQCQRNAATRRLAHGDAMDNRVADGRNAARLGPTRRPTEHRLRKRHAPRPSSWKRRARASAHLILTMRCTRRSIAWYSCCAVRRACLIPLQARVVMRGAQ